MESDLGWKAEVLGYGCLSRECPRAGSQQPGGRLSQVSLCSAETTGKGSQGWIRPAFGCTESLKQSKTQGKSFFQAPAEFALTLPHLVRGREGSGYYEHFLFIKLELQELICLLGKLAEYKAAPCPVRRRQRCQRFGIGGRSGMASAGRQS